MSSVAITKNLKTLIINQDQTLMNYDSDSVKAVTNQLKSAKEVSMKLKMTEVRNKLDEDAARSFKLAQERGSGSWLTALPLQSMGSILNKEEFCDSIRLRYGWQIPNLPTYCVCGHKNDVDHTLTCKRGGHIIFRHDRIKHTNAEFMRQVCHDVQIEPELLPVNSQHIRGITTDKARLDISARGLFGPFQKTMFDVRVFHPNAPSYRTKDITQLYQTHEPTARKSRTQEPGS